MRKKINDQFFFPFSVFLFYAFVNFLIYVFKNFFDVLFCPLNCFFGTNKSALDKNLKTITCSTIYTFPSYLTSDDTVRNFHKLMEYFTQAFRNMPNYSFFQNSSNCKLFMLVFISWLQKKFHRPLWVSICPGKRGILGQKNLNHIVSVL